MQTNLFDSSARFYNVAAQRKISGTGQPQEQEKPDKV